MGKIVLMDGGHVLRKAYYSVPVMTNSEGAHTNAIFGFLNILLKLIDRETPDYLCVVFGAQTDEEKLPEGLRGQFSVLKDLLSAMHIFHFENAESGTADLLGTIVNRLAIEEAVLVTGSRDLLQLASDKVKLCIPETKGGQTGFYDYTAADVEAAYHIAPAQIPALQALSHTMGIGERTALELLKTYNTIENLYAHLEELAQKSIREKCAGQEDAVRKAVDSCTIDTALQVDLSALNIEDMRCEKEALFTPEAGAQLKKLSLNKKFEQCTVQSRTPAIDINKDIRVVTITAVQDVQSAFDTAIKAGNAAVRMLHVRAKGQGELDERADGQMCLQMDTAEAAFGCILCGGSSDERIVYHIECAGEISESYLKEQIARMLSAEKMSVSVFDVKNDYGDLISQESDRTCSSYALTEHIFDCKIAAYLVNPLKNDYEITDVAAEYLDTALSKWSDLFGKSDLGAAYRNQKEACISYLAKQAFVLYRARPLLGEALRQTRMDKLFRELEMPLTYVLFDMEREGILVKPEELKAYGEALNGRIEELEKAVHAAAGEVFNINSPKQLGEILFEKMQLPEGKKTKTGYSTAADVLEKLAPEYPIVKDILEYRGLTKLKSTYADGLAAYIEADNKIHTNFNQTITATGRLSSTEPNLQNIPMRMELGRRIRKVFIPQEGCIFMDADYSQIELRVLAHMSDDKQLIEAYRMDEDIHRITASKVFHTPFEEVTDLQRRNAKAVNFGIVYGISSFGLSQDLSITPREAKEYIDAYFKTYPGIKKFLDKMVEDAKENGYCETMFGRRRPVPELKSSNFNQRSFGERVAMNSPIQGTAADIIKIAMIHVYDALKAKGFRSKLILQIHDELLIETRTDEVEAVREVLSQEMQNACELAVKLEIDLHTGTDWYEAK